MFGVEVSRRENLCVDALAIRSLIAIGYSHWSLDRRRLLYFEMDSVPSSKDLWDGHDPIFKVQFQPQRAKVRCGTTNLKAIDSPDQA